MHATHWEAEQRYEAFRLESRRFVASQLPYPDRGSIRLDAISDSALGAAASWTGGTLRRVTWNWATGYGEFRFRHPDRFELAVWHGSTLCSLSLGRPSRHGHSLRLDFVESSPSEHPLRGRVVPITLINLRSYAEVIGATELRIISPLNQALIDYYTRFGYTYVNRASSTIGADYLYRKLL